MYGKQRYSISPGNDPSPLSGQILPHLSMLKPSPFPRSSFRVHWCPSSHTCRGMRPPFPCVLRSAFSLCACARVALTRLVFGATGRSVHCSRDGLPSRMRVPTPGAGATVSWCRMLRTLRRVVVNPGGHRIQAMRAFPSTGCRQEAYLRTPAADAVQKEGAVASASGRALLQFAFTSSRASPVNWRQPSCWLPEVCVSEASARPEDSSLPP